MEHCNTVAHLPQILLGKGTTHEVSKGISWGPGVGLQYTARAGGKCLDTGRATGGTSEL